MLGKGGTPALPTPPQASLTQQCSDSCGIPPRTAASRATGQPGGPLGSQGSPLAVTAQAAGAAPQPRSGPGAAPLRPRCRRCLPGPGRGSAPGTAAPDPARPPVPVAVAAAAGVAPRPPRLGCLGDGDAAAMSDLSSEETEEAEADLGVRRGSRGVAGAYHRGRRRPCPASGPLLRRAARLLWSHRGRWGRAGREAAQGHRRLGRRVREGQRGRGKRTLPVTVS